jgi:hypothetical protein
MRHFHAKAKAAFCTHEPSLSGGSGLEDCRSQEGTGQKTNKHSAKSEETVGIQPDQKGNGLIALYDGIHLFALR